MNSTPVFSSVSWWQRGIPYLFFEKSLPSLKTTTIFDIGSRDGSDARRFKQISPEAQVVAFEANPILHEKIKSISEIKSHHLAISNFNGESEFYVFDSATQCGSLRESQGCEQDKVKVSTMTLDTVVEKFSYNTGRMAMWIDVEGCGFEVLEGAKKILTQTDLIHIEVESVQHWKNQKLENEIVEFLNQEGFSIAAYYHNAQGSQGNILFLRRDKWMNLISQPWYWYEMAKLAAKKMLGRLES